MYGKIFSSMYDGTLRANWQALVTFQQFIVLSDAHGIVDMTAHAIHGRTGIPLEIIEPGIQALEAPDANSRSSEADGRRIVRLDESRPWGWRIVNYSYYRNLASADEKREKDRARLARKRRNVSQTVADGREASRDVVKVAQAEEEAEANKTKPLARRDNGASLGDGEVVEKIPTVGGEVEVKTTFVAELERLYPAVDVPQTLREIRGWNLANPTRQKTSRGIGRHINSWMARVQNGG